MGCRMEPAVVHIAHLLQKLHFFQFLNFLDHLHDLPQKQKLHNLTIFLYMSDTFHTRQYSQHVDFLCGLWLTRCPPPPLMNFLRVHAGICGPVGASDQTRISHFHTSPQPSPQVAPMPRKGADMRYTLWPQGEGLCGGGTHAALATRRTEHGKGQVEGCYVPPSAK